MASTVINSPLGAVLIEGDAAGITKISISEEQTERSSSVPEELTRVVLQLNDYFAGQRETFDLKLNLKGTEFQKKVWLELLNIPFGQTRSYLELARKLGDEKSIRAVAAANGRNPLWVVIPCHRVIGSDGSLTGYAGGLWRKKWLLEHESGTEQFSLF